MYIGIHNNNKNMLRLGEKKTVGRVTRNNELILGGPMNDICIVLKTRAFVRRWVPCYSYSEKSSSFEYQVHEERSLITY